MRYVITKFSRMDSLPNFLTHGALLAHFARESSAINLSTRATFLSLAKSIYYERQNNKKRRRR